MSGLGSVEESGIGATFEDFLAQRLAVEPDGIVGDAAGHGAAGEEFVAVESRDGVAQFTLSEWTRPICALGEFGLHDGGRPVAERATPDALARDDGHFLVADGGVDSAQHG